MRVKLVLIGDQGERTVYRLKKVPTVIGRGRDADLTLAHPLASRHHCELYEVEGTLCVRDLGSLNGTFVGDFRVTEAALESGDILTIGGARFEVLVDKEAEPLMPPPASSLASPAAAPQQQAEVADPEVIEPEIVEPEIAEPIEAEELEELDFAEIEPVETTPTVSAKPETKPAPAPKSPSPQPKTQPVNKSKPKDAPASSQSRIDLAALGEEAPNPISTDDSGLSSFLKKL